VTPAIAPTTPAPATTAAATARAWLDAVTRRDLDGFHALLDPHVWFRMLLPREVLEWQDARPTTAVFHEWYVTPRRIELIDAGHHTMAGREHVRYRFRLQPTWAPDTWHLIEQAGYLRIADGRVRRIDLVCTGFHPQH
jgi:hypothetical protein